MNIYDEILQEFLREAQLRMPGSEDLVLHVVRDQQGARYTAYLEAKMKSGVSVTSSVILWDTRYWDLPANIDKRLAEAKERLEPLLKAIEDYCKTGETRSLEIGGTMTITSEQYDSQKRIHTPSDFER